MERYNMKIKCEVINDLLPLYVDDVLSKESRELVEEHICECESCKNTLENMSGKVSLPVNPELRKDDTKPIKGLKKFVTKWKRLTAVITVLAVIAVLFLFGMYASTKLIKIPYDGHNFTLEFIEDRYCIVFHGEGSFGFSAEGNSDNGEWNVEFYTTLLDKITEPVKPALRSLFNIKEYDYIPLCEKDQIIRLTTRDGKVIREADGEEIKEFKEKHSNPKG
jgi:hypothetical protein